MSSQRKNRSRKKDKTHKHTETLVFDSQLMHSFIGKPNTLPDLVKNYKKISIRFSISDDEKMVNFYVSGKNRHNVKAVAQVLTSRYNNVVKVTNDIIKTLIREKETDN